MAAKWPKKYEPFRRAVAKHSSLILSGTLLAIDPASGKSSMPGYALFVGGQLKEHGTIEITPSKAPEVRLLELYECLREDFKGIDVLAVEQLRGNRVQPVVHASVWFTRAAIMAGAVIEVPISYWKALAKVSEGYEKSDDLDAAMIGGTVVEVARAFQQAS
jgi:hypothetical protein